MFQVYGLNLIYGCIMLIIYKIHFTGVQNSENWQTINQQRITNNKK